MSKRSETTRKSAESVDTEELLRETAAKLRTLLASVEQHGDGEHPSVIRDTARLATAITAIAGELRQHAKERARKLAEYALEDIVNYLKTLPRAKQDEAFTLAFGTDEREPLL